MSPSNSTDHPGSILYLSESSEVQYSTNQYLVRYFFCFSVHGIKNNQLQLLLHGIKDLNCIAYIFKDQTNLTIRFPGCTTTSVWKTGRRPQSSERPSRKKGKYFVLAFILAVYYSQNCQILSKCIKNKSQIQAPTFKRIKALMIFQLLKKIDCLSYFF